jgi:anti-sigma B factor antagonist
LEEKKMTINKTLNASELTVALAGRLDTTTAPQLEAELKTALTSVNSLVMNFAELEYISSAGLRVLLSAQKVMNKQGKMVIRNANETILEVFEVTGFTDILTVE